VAKFEDNTPRTKKVMIQVQVCGRQWQSHQDYSNTTTLFSKKVKLKNPKGNNPKLGKVELWFGSFALHFFLMRSFYLQNFKLKSLVVSKLCPGQDICNGPTTSSCS
jgi:hypothetical protein